MKIKIKKSTKTKRSSLEEEYHKLVSSWKAGQWVTNWMEREGEKLTDWLLQTLQGLRDCDICLSEGWGLEVDKKTELSTILFEKQIP